MWPKRTHPNEKGLEILFAHCDQVVVGGWADIHFFWIHGSCPFSGGSNGLPNVMNAAVRAFVPAPTCHFLMPAKKSVESRTQS